MGTQSIKDSRIGIRINVGQKALIEQAAAAQGKGLTEFMVAASTEAAEIALAERNRFSLSEKDMERFLAKLEEEPQVLPKLRELFERQSVLGE